MKNNTIIKKEIELYPFQLELWKQCREQLVEIRNLGDQICNIEWRNHEEDSSRFESLMTRKNFLERDSLALCSILVEEFCKQFF